MPRNTHSENGSWGDRWYYGKPWEHFEDAWRQSPLATAQHAKTPFLLLQGGADATGAATRTYDNGQLSMWYSATATGLEQGFTLKRGPAGTNGAVTIAML